jgi:acetyltransferase-like isoleucine patch superfamily enzyme
MNRGIEVSAREVVATFGRRLPGPDPDWEQQMAAFLKQSQSVEELVSHFARFQAGEGIVDAMMRRALMRSLCKRVGSDLQVGQNVILKHPETMDFGDSVFIGSQAMIQGRFDGTCTIGSHVWIGPQAYLDARNLVLEDYVGWGPGAKVLGSVHTGMPIEQPIVSTPLVIKPVTIGFGADIGMNASILPGVRIGAHAIVGAGAVVTHDVPAYCVVAGVPARVIHDRRET